MFVSESIDICTDACEDIGNAVYRMLGFLPFAFETAEPLGSPEELTEQQYEMRIQQIQPEFCPPLAQDTSTQYDPLDEGLPTTTSPPPPHHENSTPDSLSLQLEAVSVTPRQRDLPQMEMPKILPSTPPPTPIVEDLIHSDQESYVLVLPLRPKTPGQADKA